MVTKLSSHAKCCPRPKSPWLAMHTSTNYYKLRAARVITFLASSELTFQRSNALTLNELRVCHDFFTNLGVRPIQV